MPDICHADIQQGSTLLKRLNDISTLAQLAERYIRMKSHMIPIPALGLLFTWAALALLHLPLDDRLAKKFIAAQGTNKASCVSTMVYCSNLCISLCKEYAPPNEVLLWLLHESLTLTAQFYGDCSHQTWQRLGDLATEALDPSRVRSGTESPAVSFLLSQSRRKILASAYWIDKSLASLHAQVPRIPCLPQDFETPLDIDDDELLSKSLSHSELLHSHSSGWNQSAHTCPATYIRARYILGGLRDELLQLSLTASAVNRLLKLKVYDGTNELQDHSPSPLELIRNISAFISYLGQECYADGQLSLSYISTYKNLECALNDLLDLKQIYALGCGSGASSSTVSPGSEILGNYNSIEGELIDWTNELEWMRQWSV
ncbi:hypothetical protein BDV38DRAFT_269647 [Aspergillus pseudotamarii]|uniref:Transcription factor domain-containing protein n=1 Tax=Aspergillus pseudotamarii TaxID=132259 RepID=A0A5N6T0I4_ASPPS|nr:uncharacterized protein BDV38DRAFT_269647 [Aspergillus pseudotamarii]KAE8139877.1 hypothetical protein BDV38DRAFT_269647 [Aspergillus pseudotamarii]